MKSYTYIYHVFDHIGAQMLITTAPTLGRNSKNTALEAARTCNSFVYSARTVAVALIGIGNNMTQ